MIPKAGDQIQFAGFSFTVLEVEDNRRVTSLLAAPLTQLPTSPPSVPTMPLAVASAPLDKAAEASAKRTPHLAQRGGARRGSPFPLLEGASTSPSPSDSSSTFAFATADSESSAGPEEARTTASAEVPTTSPSGEGLEVSSEDEGPAEALEAAAVDSEEGDVLIFRDGEWLQTTSSSSPPLSSTALSGDQAAESSSS